MMTGSSASVLKLDSSSRRSLAAFLPCKCQTTSWMSLKLPDREGISFLTRQTVQSKHSEEGENQALSMSYSLPPTRFSFSSQFISKIFLFNGILLLHQKSVSQAKNSVSPLQSAPIGTLFSMTTVLPAHDGYGRFLMPWRSQGGLKKKGAVFKSWEDFLCDTFQASLWTRITGVTRVIFGAISGN